jgi:hypothetical protein
MGSTPNGRGHLVREVGDVHPSLTALLGWEPWSGSTSGTGCGWPARPQLRGRAEAVSLPGRDRASEEQGPGAGVAHREILPSRGLAAEYP